MRSKITLSFILILLLLASIGARTQNKSFDSQTLFPQSESKFYDNPKAHELYNKMIETMRKAETLSYESEYWNENIKPGADKPEYSSLKSKSKYKIWLKKGNLARIEQYLLKDKEYPYTTIIGDGDYFWAFWTEPYNKRLENVYMKESAEKYSISYGMVDVMGFKPTINPSLFYKNIDEPYQVYIDGMKLSGTEKINGVECHIIEISFLKHQISKYIWLSKSDYLPRKTKEINETKNRGYPFEIVTNELLINITINTPIKDDKFVWKPSPSSQMIDRMALYSKYSQSSYDFGKTPDVEIIPTVEPINISGEWKYCIGDDPSWAFGNYDDKGWSSVDIPYILPDLALTGTIWIRKLFFVPEYYKNQKYAIQLGIISAPTRIYFNGVLIDDSTELPNVIFGGMNLLTVRIEIPSNSGLIWTGEPIFKPLSGWIEADFFDKREFFIRHYVIFIPNSYSKDKPSRMIVAMPGFPGGRHAFNDRKISDLAESRGYIIVCPDIVYEGTDYKLIGSIQQEITSLLSDVKKKYNIDSKKIYTMGHSNGGFYAYYIGLHNCDIFAGIASSCGAIGGTRVDLLPNMAKSAKEKIPVYIQHGAKDKSIPVTRANYMYSELKAFGYDCELYVYPEGDHYVLYKQDGFEKILDFFESHPRKIAPQAWDKLEHTEIDKLPASDEGSIKKTIKNLIEGCNKRDTKKVMKCFSDGYVTDEVTYPDIRNSINKFFSDNKHIQMKTNDDIKIIVYTNKAGISIIVPYTLKTDDKKTESGKMWFRFAKEDDNWKIIGGSRF